MNTIDLTQKETRLKVYKIILNFYLLGDNRIINKGFCRVFDILFNETLMVYVYANELKYIFIELFEHPLYKSYDGYYIAPRGETKLRIKILKDAIFQLEHPILYKISNIFKRTYLYKILTSKLDV